MERTEMRERKWLQLKDEEAEMRELMASEEKPGD